jgi:hypothetical protein
MPDSFLRSAEEKHGRKYSQSGSFKHEDYGQSPGQLASLPVGDCVAVLTSPPYATGDTASAQSIENRSDKSADWIRRNTGLKTGYGVTEGQLGAMKEGEISSVITSPPFMSTHAGDEGEGRMPGRSGVGYKDATYSDEHPRDSTIGGDRTSDAAKQARQLRAQTTKNIGCIVQSGNNGKLVNAETYWSAVAEIYRQCFLALKPGGYLACVVKAYIKKGKIVPLPEQTWELLQHVGFEPVERVRAMLVKEDSHPGLFDGPVVKKTERKSFFRRLAEKKGSPAIDFEEVLFLRKPL